MSLILKNKKINISKDGSYVKKNIKQARLERISKLVCLNLNSGNKKNKESNLKNWTESLTSKCSFYLFFTFIHLLLTL